jgi:hypothetical protein
MSHAHPLVNEKGDNYPRLQHDPARGILRRVVDPLEPPQLRR